MATPLPGNAVPAVSAAMPPRPGEERPPQLPIRAKAALTFFDNQAVFVILAEDVNGHAQFLRFARRKPVSEAQTS